MRASFQSGFFEREFGLQFKNFLRIRDSGFGIRDSGFGVRRSGFGIRDSDSLRLERENVRIPNPELRIPNSESLRLERENVRSCFSWKRQVPGEWPQKVLRQLVRVTVSS